MAVYQLVLKIKGKTLIIEHSGKYPLLTILLQNNIDINYSCKSAKCGYCKATILTGKTEMNKTNALSYVELKNSKILLCQAKQISQQAIVEI